MSYGQRVIEVDCKSVLKFRMSFLKKKILQSDDLKNFGFRDSITVGNTREFLNRCSMLNFKSQTKGIDRIYHSIPQRLIQLRYADYIKTTKERNL